MGGGAREGDASAEGPGLTEPGVPAGRSGWDGGSEGEATPPSEGRPRLPPPLPLPAGASNSISDSISRTLSSGRRRLSAAPCGGEIIDCCCCEGPAC